MIDRETYCETLRSGVVSVFRHDLGPPLRPESSSVMTQEGAIRSRGYPYSLLNRGASPHYSTTAGSLTNDSVERRNSLRISLDSAKMGGWCPFIHEWLELELSLDNWTVQENCMPYRMIAPT